VEVTGEEVQKTGQGLGAVLAALDQLKHERRLFIEAVREYNWDIAEYLLNVAPLGTSDQTLVSKLILVDGGRDTQPTPNRGGDRTFAPADGAAKERSNEPAVAQQRTAEYQPQDAQTSNETGLYSGLAQLEPQQRADRLAGLLHWNRALPEGAGQPTSLADCLRGATPQALRALIAAYWQAREVVARYQALSEQSDQLNTMSTVTIGARDTPGMAEAGVRLQSMRRSARAAVLDAEATLVNSQFLLTQLAGRQLDKPWILPDTPPHAHHAKTPADAQKPASRTARLVDMQETRLGNLAEAVIQADLSRAALVTEAHQSSTPPADQAVLVDLVVRAVGSQTEHTLAFLSALTEYNLAVAEHVLVTVPANTPGDVLARQLAAERAAPDKS
jgi:hypothetical protein